MRPGGKPWLVRCHVLAPGPAARPSPTSPLVFTQSPAQRPTSQHAAIRCAVTAAFLRTPTGVLKPGGRGLPVTSQIRLSPARRRGRPGREGALAAAASMPAVLRDHQGRRAGEEGKERTRGGLPLAAGAPDHRPLGWCDSRCELTCPRPAQADHNGRAPPSNYWVTH